MRPRARVRLSEIASQWDRIAVDRYEQVVSGLDISARKVIAPAMLRLAAVRSDDTVADLGCGTGFFSNELARRARSVNAIDISGESIRIAKANYERPNLRFAVCSIESLAMKHENQFSLIVANMVLMTTPGLTRNMKALSKLIAPGGRAVFSITHPWFWPRYWGYEDEDWFDYSAEIAIETEFRVSRQRLPQVTIHVHRPMSAYADAFMQARLSIGHLQELRPRPDTEALYPQKWDFPRFLAGRLYPLASEQRSPLGN